MEGRGFLGGLDEKMRRMWLGLEIVMGGFPHLPQHHANKKHLSKTSRTLYIQLDQGQTFINSRSLVGTILFSFFRFFIFY